MSQEIEIIFTCHHLLSLYLVKNFQVVKLPVSQGDRFVVHVFDLVDDGTHGHHLIFIG